MDRRAYLRSVGTVGVAVGFAGCLGDGEVDDSPTAEDGATPGPEGDTEVTAGTAPGFPPFEIKEGGDLIGFDIDLLEATVEAADGYTMSGWREFEFDSLIPALTAGNIDVIAAAMTITEERDQSIDFSDPYYSSDQSIIVRTGDAGEFSELSDLADVVVGAQSGTTGEGVVQDELIATGELAESDYRAFDNYVLAVQALENGDVDAVMIDEPVGATFADQRDVEVAFVHETGEEFGFGIREGDDEFRGALNDGLAAVREASQYSDITNDWFGQG